jgi:hypothetical protein
MVSRLHQRIDAGKAQTPPATGVRRRSSAALAAPRATTLAASKAAPAMTVLAIDDELSGKRSGQCRGPFSGKTHFQRTTFIFGCLDHLTISAGARIMHRMRAPRLPNRCSSRQSPFVEAIQTVRIRSTRFIGHLSSKWPSPFSQYGHRRPLVSPAGGRDRSLCPARHVVNAPPARQWYN